MVKRKEIVGGLCVGLLAAVLTLGEPNGSIVSRKLEREASCDLSEKEITVEGGDVQNLPSGNFKIDYTGGPETVAACCGDFAADDNEDNDADEICREIVVGDAFCDLAAESEIGITTDDEGNDVPAACPFQGDIGPDECVHTLTLSYDIVPHNGETCCRDCTCFGDPNCVSFENQRDLWIVCDGRRTYIDEDGNVRCKQQRRGCGKETDHLGKDCVWLPDFLPEYNSETHGSRCSSSWGSNTLGLLGSTYPTMVMLEADGFSVILTLGALGIIREVELVDDDGTDFSLTAQKCFEYDPHTVTEAETKQAWSPSTIPSDWSTVISSRPENPEIKWKVNNARTGFFLEIVCQTVGGVPRLNIEHLIEPNDDREGQGFCYEGSIENKIGHSAKSDEIHPICTAAFLGDNIEVCKAVVGEQCNADSYADNVEAYCADFDFLLVTGISSVSDCVSTLTTGDASNIGQEWTRMVCEANQLDVTNCMTTILEDGWETFLTTHSDGLITGGNDVSTCATSIDQYTNEVEECTRATRVEYEESEDNWVIAFVIPDDLPPCSGKLDIPVTMENLYTKPIRFTQCGLSADCLVKENACQPTNGVTISVDFTEECEPPPPAPSPPPTEPLVCNCEESPGDQEICDGSDEYNTLGECDSCCINVENPNLIIEGECRSISTAHPYCNPEDDNQADKCTQLENDSVEAKLTLKFETDDDVDSLECCPTCQCWGDPQCRSFEGIHDVWLLCESRGDTCTPPEEGICTSFHDHVGNACVWDSEIAAKVAANRPDIGAYGSPCQPDWETSGDAIMTMYSIGDFSAKLTMGERGVIEDLIIKDAPANTYSLVADNCFSFTDEADFLNTWTVVGAAPNGDDSISIQFVDETPTERVFHIFDDVSKVFIQVACIKRDSEDGTASGYRLNVENLVDMRYDRPTGGDGFCVTNEIDTLESEVDDELFNKCHEGGVGITELCQNLWSDTCTRKSDIDRAVGEWCKTAYVFRGEEDHDIQCVQYILHNNDEEDIIERWVEKYCEAVGAATYTGTELTSFIATCESNVRMEGIEQAVENHGTGKYSDYCVADVSEYSTRGDDECNSGISIQTCPKANGECEEEDWVEEFFIPEGAPPCGGELEILASTHINLFTRRWRFNQCYERDGENCSMAQKCAPVVGWDISYKYEENSSVCDRRLR